MPLAVMSTPTTPGAPARKWTPSSRKARGVPAQCSTEATLVLGSSRRNTQVEPQELGAGAAAIRALQRLARVFEQKAQQVGAVVCGRAVDRKDRHVKDQVQFRCDHWIRIERLEPRLILWFGRIPLVLEGCSDDQLLHQRVGHARDLYERPVCVRRVT